MVFTANSPLTETQKAQDYIDVMVDIRKYTNEFENETPSIVAFGDQSAGKSCLMQRLTGGIPVPKGDGRCTATPFEIRMLQKPVPVRKISLRYVENSKREKYPSPREVDFYDILDLDDDAVEKKLREAQRYVLNPSINPSSENLGNSDELMFTRNAICVTIGDPDQQFSLAMVDLPGIIRDNQENEEFVTSLVKEYISKDTTILLPIFQAVTDIATQSAWRLAKEADPDSKRTVGVLTKIDRSFGDEVKLKQLANFVEGKGEHQLAHGVYVVRNPGSGEIFDDSDEIEQKTISELMQNTDWRNVPGDRLGLKYLIDKLSELQRLALDKAWPRIRPELERRREEMETELGTIPEAPKGNPRIQFLETIGTFDKDFTDHARANDIDHRLYRGQQWNFGEFDKSLYKTRPRYILSIDGQPMNPDFDPIKVGVLQVDEWTLGIREEIYSDPWSEDFTANETQYTWKMGELCETIQRTQGGQLVGHFPYKSVVHIVARHQKEWSKISQKLLEKNFEWVARFTNDFVDNRFHQFPFAVDLVKTVLYDLLKSRRGETLGQLKALEAMDHMSANRALYITDEATLLNKQYKYYIQMRILSANKETKVKLDKLLDQGRKFYDSFNKRSPQPTSIENATFEGIKAELLKILGETQTKDETSQRLIEDIKTFQLTTGKTPSAATASLMITAKNVFLEKLLPKNLDVDNKQNSLLLSSTINEQAFLAATSALAYWKMAHSRFREIVPRVVEYYLVHKFSTELGHHLRKRFGLLPTGHDESDTLEDENDEIMDKTILTQNDSFLDLDSILGENPEFTQRRQKLEEDINTLTKIIDKVRRISII